jgi:hypothetical protein
MSLQPQNPKRLGFCIHGRFLPQSGGCPLEILRKSTGKQCSVLNDSNRVTNRAQAQHRFFMRSHHLRITFLLPAPLIGCHKLSNSAALDIMYGWFYSRLSLGTDVLSDVINLDIPGFAGYCTDTCFRFLLSCLQN